MVGVADVIAPVPAGTARPPADVVMRRLLRLPDQRPPGTPRPDVHRAFSLSIVVSAVRCVLTYLVLPFLAPALGAAKGVGPWIGIPLGVLAIVFNVLSIRRFWAADHKWRWIYTAIATMVIILLAVLITTDVLDLLR